MHEHWLGHLGECFQDLSHVRFGRLLVISHWDMTKLEPLGLVIPKQTIRMQSKSTLDVVLFVLIFFKQANDCADAQRLHPISPVYNKCSSLWREWLTPPAIGGVVSKWPL